MHKIKHKNNYGYSLAIPAILFYGTFFCVPLLLCFATAFTDWNIRRLAELSFNGLENFTTIFKDPYFRLSIQNTLVFALATTLFKVILGLLLALALTQRFRGVNLIRSVFYMPAVLSTVIIGLVFTSVFQVDGLWDSILAVFGVENPPIWLGDPDTALGAVIFTEIWQWSGFAMVLFITGLQSISKEYYEAAMIDGASAFQRFGRITLPLLAPSFTIVIINNLIGGLKVFDKVYVLTNGGPGRSSQVLGTYVYQSFSAGFLGKSSAMSLLLTILVAGITLLVNHQLRKREVDA